MNQLEFKTLACLKKEVLPELVKGEKCNLHVVLKEFVKAYNDALLKQGVKGRYRVMEMHCGISHNTIDKYTK